MNELLFKNGDLFPSIGLGTWLSKKNEVYNAVLAAIKIGYRHIDCASIYGNEAEIGEAIAFAVKSGLVKREDLFVTSKLWNSDHEPRRVEIALRKSLSDLQLDYLDLYLIHWPIAFKTGCEQAKVPADLVPLFLVPLSSTWEAMVDVKEKGLTKHIGVSNFTIPKLKSLIKATKIVPEVLQVELHPYLQQIELLSFCKENKILVTAYSPLGSRHLMSGDGGLTKETIIIQIAEKHKCSAVQVVLSWGLFRGTSVIPKSTNPSRILENYNSLNVELDAEDYNEIAVLERNLRMAKGAFCVMPGSPYTLEGLWEQ